MVVKHNLNMIQNININSLNTNRNVHPKTQPQFKGSIGDGVLVAIQLCEQNPMMNVTILDLATAIGPRTIIESKTNAHAGFEAFRRESSGLIVNCLIPGIIVLGIAKVIQKSFLGKDTKMAKCWANQETIELVSEQWKTAKGATTETKISNTLKKIIYGFEGVDGDVNNGGLKSFKDFDLDKGIKIMTDEAMGLISSKDSKEQLENAYISMVKKTHISENLKFSNKTEYFSSNLKSLVHDVPKVLKEFVSGNTNNLKSVDTITNKAIKLLNTKSLMGLGIVVPLAISMQPLNRWITARRSGKKGAPIYKDFQDTKVRKLSKKQKSSLFKQKLISVGAMIGVGILSMMKKPSMKMFQFKGLFPTMDQARLISAAAFSSRMLSSEDENELRESTVRDIATFSSFYFIGDYAAKGMASLIEKVCPNIKLLNRTKIHDKNLNMLQKFGNWVKHTSLKSSNEVIDKVARKRRAFCQLSNIGFSLVLLGLLIPLYTRGKTDKKHKEELEKMGLDKKEIDKYYPQFAMNKHNASRIKTYKAFNTEK